MHSFSFTIGNVSNLNENCVRKRPIMLSNVSTTHKARFPCNNIQNKCTEQAATNTDHTHTMYTCNIIHRCNVHQLTAASFCQYATLIQWSNKGKVTFTFYAYYSLPPFESCTIINPILSGYSQYTAWKFFNEVSNTAKNLILLVHFLRRVNTATCYINGEAYFTFVSSHTCLFV